MAANRERGEVDLALGDETFVLRLTISAVVALEAASGRSFGDLLDGIKQGKVQDSEWLLWAALQPRHATAFPDFASVQRAFDDLPALMDAFTVIRSAVGDLMALNSPPRQGGQADPQKAQAGTGSASTLAPAVLA